MVMINRAAKELTLKIVYYGPGLCGKTTNLEFIYQKANPEKRGKLLTVATETDRTLFFDFLPMELGSILGMKLRVQLYTVPGQVFYDATRRIVLRGSDGVVFVADSQKVMMEANLESVENMKKNMELNGLDYEKIPLVFQYNKHDLPGLASREELEQTLNWRRVPSFDAVATVGTGVNETVRKIIEMVIRRLHEQEAGLKGHKMAPAQEAPRQPEAPPPSPAPVAPPTPPPAAEVTPPEPEPEPATEEPPAPPPEFEFPGGPAAPPEEHEEVEVELESGDTFEQGSGEPVLEVEPASPEQLPARVEDEVSPDERTLVSAEDSGVTEIELDEEPAPLDEASPLAEPEQLEAMPEPAASDAAVSSDASLPEIPVEESLPELPQEAVEVEPVTAPKVEDPASRDRLVRELELYRHAMEEFLLKLRGMAEEVDVIKARISEFEEKLKS